MEVSAEQEIQQVEMEKPHVVILGAGASYATFPRGDKNGTILPLMNNFVDVLGLDDLLAKTGLGYKNRNFEEIYDDLYQDDEYKVVREELEEEIHKYFSQLQILDEPTIYDHLLLSLRAKDVIATFNWDSLLLQAYRRNARQFKLSRLLFLHGNVGVGSCEEGKVAGINGASCSKCGSMFSPTRLLYPIAEKNYHLDGFISSQWEELNHHLKNAFMITVFGYGAPQSDVSAVDLMKSAWGDVNQRAIEQTEIIDIRDEEELHSTWEPFIHTHHYEMHHSFYDSWIANHPRRTGEAYINQYLNAYFIDDNPIPKEAEFTELWEWFNRLQEVENLDKRT